jgi:hypothetical protein
MKDIGIVSDDLRSTEDLERAQTIVTRTFENAAQDYQRQIDRAVSKNEPLTVFLSGVRAVHGLRDLLPALSDHFRYMSTAGVQVSDLTNNITFARFRRDLKSQGIEIDQVMIDDTETTGIGVATFGLHRRPG